MRHPFPCSARSAPRLSRPSFARGGQQRGVSLIVVLILLVIISILGIGAAQLSMMGERGSRNERDLQIAWQGAEAGLMDAEFDMRGPGTSNRMGVFTKNDSSASSWVAVVPITAEQRRAVRSPSHVTPATPCG